MNKLWCWLGYHDWTHTKGEVYDLPRDFKFGVMVCWHCPAIRRVRGD